MTTPDVVAGLFPVHGLGVFAVRNCRSASCRGEVPGSFFDLQREDQRRLAGLRLREWPGPFLC